MKMVQTMELCLRSLTYVIFISLLLCFSIREYARAQQATRGSADDLDWLDQYQLEYDLSPFGKMAIHYKGNHKISYNIKLSKILLDYHLANRAGVNGKHYGRVALREDLIYCKNFLPDRPEMESLIDCKPPLEARDIDEALSTKKFVKRLSVIIKSKSISKLYLGLDSSFDELVTHFYPYEMDFVQQNLNQILHDGNITNQNELDFGPYSFTSGYLVTFNTKRHIKCGGNLFYTVNLTEPIPDLEPDDRFPELLHKLDHILMAIINHGGIVSLKDFSCKIDDTMISVQTDFTIIYRQKFPYVTCEHHIKTSPLSSLWTYDGYIRQYKNQSSPSSEAYKTEINIVSKSWLMPQLDFVLSQKFTNEDFRTGSENMVLINPKLIVGVTGNWTINSMFKTLSIYMGHKKIEQPSLNNLQMALVYEDHPVNEFIKLSLLINRNIGLANNADEPTDIDEPKVELIKDDLEFDEIFDLAFGSKPRDEL